MRLLVIEDQYALRQDLAKGLSLQGYIVDTADNGVDGYELLCVNSYDLVLLDLNLPQRDGLSILVQLKAEQPQLKVLILSARDSVSDKIKGLDLGANDYMSKPFHFDELLARVRGLLRVHIMSNAMVMTVGRVTLDSHKKQVTVGDTPISLSSKEYQLLHYLFCHRDKIVSQEEFLEHVWGDSVDCFTATVRVHISNIRKKLVEAGLEEPLIQSVVGRGYLIASLS